MDLEEPQVSGRAAFEAFESGKVRLLMPEKFEDRLDRVKREIAKLEREVKAPEDGKEPIITEIENLKEKAETISQKTQNSIQAAALQSTKVPDVSALLNNLSLREGSTPEEALTLTLKYNPNAKNLLVAAKISEFKKRLDLVKSCVSNWNHKTLSITDLLERAYKQLELMDEVKIKTETVRIGHLLDEIVNFQ